MRPRPRRPACAAHAASGRIFILQPSTMPRACRDALQRPYREAYAASFNIDIIAPKACTVLHRCIIASRPCSQLHSGCRPSQGMAIRRRAADRCSEHCARHARMSASDALIEPLTFRLFAGCVLRSWRLDGRVPEAANT